MFNTGPPANRVMDVKYLDNSDVPFGMIHAEHAPLGGAMACFIFIGCPHVSGSS